jgi:hypothetical protein
MYNKPFKEELAAYRRQKVKQINDPGNPGPGTRRRFCNLLHHFQSSRKTATWTWRRDYFDSHKAREHNEIASHGEPSAGTSASFAGGYFVLFPESGRFVV